MFARLMVLFANGSPPPVNPIPAVISVVILAFADSDVDSPLIFD